MQCVLDIDLDFFLDRILYCADEPQSRPKAADFNVDSTESALSFLQDQCQLIKGFTRPGACCVQHKEVFFHWERMIKEGVLKTPFEVIHIDAHADMGFGNPSCLYIAEQYLAQPLKKRKVPLRGGPWALNNCNFLAYALAARWIGSLTYVTHPRYEDDVQWVHMKDFSTTSGFVEMKQFEPGVAQRLNDPMAIKTEPFRAEPAIPMTVVPRADFQLNRTPDFVFISQSPGYAPTTADPLYKAISDFVTPAHISERE
jgi:hypothetical protein